MIDIILDFIEQNWNSFLIHCKQHGIKDEKEVEESLDSFKMLLNMYSKF